ncbi:hypothetical protein [Pelomonas sp. KK5]|uniref:hypothetical protein n=1 Tax=Pelomonas sp. KK5 TaxID=1855730 RepID=UPI00117ECEB4|nr:hypothetical protein [Pelomonas sp. KK5]
MRFLLVGLGAWALAGLACAQDAAPPERPAAVACLRKPAEPLKYPERARELRDSGRLKARLTFTGADRAPRVELLAWSGSPEMAEAAELYLRGYRLPCLAAGERVALDQEIVFTASADEDQAAMTASASAGVWDCLRTPPPFSYQEDMQTGRLIKQKANGTLLLELSFAAPDAAPKIRMLYNTTPHAFTAAAESDAAGYRLPCMTPGSGPYVHKQVYRFKSFARERDLVLKDMGLMDFLRAVKDPDKVPVKFDLGSMACPFKLKWRMYQPADSNVVREVGAPVAQRRAFIEWLSTLSLDLGKDQVEALLGAETVITVPCGTIEL